MSRRKEIALVTAGILAGIAVSGPAAQAAAGLMANPSNQKFYLDDQRISLTAYEIGGSNYVKLRDIGQAVDFGVTYDAATLKLGAVHFEESSNWDGNVGLAAHNRGSNSYFGQIHTLELGDRITLTTKLGTRTYEVTSVSKVSETDRSALAASQSNVITLYTCVRDERDFRWCVTGSEIV